MARTGSNVLLTIVARTTYCRRGARWRREPAATGTGTGRDGNRSRPGGGAERPGRPGMRIAVVGGGPGGLYFAALARQLDPGSEITVWERNAADDTFGFGVV